MHIAAFSSWNSGRGS